MPLSRFVTPRRAQFTDSADADRLIPRRRSRRFGGGELWLRFTARLLLARRGLRYRALRGRHAALSVLAVLGAVTGSAVRLAGGASARLGGISAFVGSTAGRLPSQVAGLAGRFDGSAGRERLDTLLTGEGADRVRAKALRLRRHTDRLRDRAQLAWDARTPAQVAAGCLAFSLFLAGSSAVAATALVSPTSDNVLVRSPVASVLAVERILPVRGMPSNESVLPRLQRQSGVVPPVQEAEEIAAVAVEPAPPGLRGALPVGRGMYIWQPDKVESGRVDVLVARAREVGLDHIFVRTGSSRMGFYAQDFLNEVLPQAHAAGIRVYGWDFPYLDDPAADAARGVEAITYTTPGGHRIDGFVPDIETPSEGTHLTPEGAAHYSRLLREAVGPDFPLVVAVPRPSSAMVQRYPYDAIVPFYDGVAPMTYWLNRQPDTDVINDIEYLSRFGKPIMPIGQAYDGRPEGGRPGPPPGEEIARFMMAAEAHGAVGVSFWSWQHASKEIWDTIAAAPEFRMPEPGMGPRPGQVRMVQTLLTSLGYDVPVTGTWDDATDAAMTSYRRDAGHDETGPYDDVTRRLLLTPFAPPVAALG